MFLNFGWEMLLSIIATVFISRVWLYFTYKSFSFVTSPKFKGLKLHHYMYGIIVALLLLLKKPYLLGIGLGLLVDELSLIIRYGNTFHWKEYWS